MAKPSSKKRTKSLLGLKPQAKREPTVLFRAHRHAGSTIVLPEQKGGVKIED
jgi:hypothetical protein